MLRNDLLMTDKNSEGSVKEHSYCIMQKVVGKFYWM